MDHRDRRPILVFLGALYFLVGLVAAFLGPVEMYCFYLFSEGGPFYYEGFGFGSFMFGNIATQVMGYYVIALLMIPLGYGHLRVRRWARPFALTLLWSWLVVGMPLAIVFLLILITSKEPSLAAVVVTIILLGLCYPLLPLLLIRFYRSRDVRKTFEARDHQAYGIERVPIATLVLCFLYAFYVVVLHIPIFFRGIFPLFGTFLYELPGVILLAVSMLWLVFLIWGTLRKQLWAWWGAMVYFALLFISSVLAFATTAYLDILTGMRFPPFEMEILRGVPLQGSYLAVFFGLPLVFTLVAIILSRRYFGQSAHAEPVHAGHQPERA